MLKKISIATLITVMLAAIPAWSLDLKPGMYEITVKVEMPGMQAGMPSQTLTQCLTEQDPVPNASAGAQDCKITNMQTAGNTITYTVECNQQGMKTKSSGKITYNNETFEGTTLTDMGPSTGGMKVTTKITGKRIGDCN